MEGLPRHPEAFFQGTPAQVRAYVEQLHAYIQTLEQRVAELEARLGKDASNSSKPPSPVGPSARWSTRPPQA
jgi:hypothetical protein